MRWPRANLEEKQEPRAVTSASAERCAEGMWHDVTRKGLTKAAIEKPTFTFRKAGDVCYTPPLGEAMVEASLGVGAGVGENFRFSSIAHSWRLTPGQSFRKTTLEFCN